MTNDLINALHDYYLTLLMEIAGRERRDGRSRPHDALPLSELRELCTACGIMRDKLRRDSCDPHALAMSRALGDIYNGMKINWRENA